MCSAIGNLFKIVGVIGFLVVGIWGFLIDLAIVNHAAGFWGVVIGFVILPATFVAAPWYAVVAQGNWFPVWVTYGGGIISGICMGIGTFIAGE